MSQTFFTVDFFIYWKTWKNMEKENYFTNRDLPVFGYQSLVKLPTIYSREFMIEQREHQSKNTRTCPHSRFKSLQCNNWNSKDEMAQIISKPKQTWQEQVLIKLCCWLRIAQKQSKTRILFYSMISICVQICIYHIGFMTASH